MRWCLAVFCLPLVAAAQWCLNWKDINLYDVASSAAGRLYGVVSVDHWYRTEVWEWSEELSEHRVVFRPRGRAYGIGCSDNGGVLVMLVEDSLTAYDVSRRQVLWRETCGINEWASSDLFFTSGDRHIVLIDNAGAAFSTRRAMDQISVFDAESGALIGKHQGNSAILRVDSSDEWIRYVTRAADVVTLCVEEGQLHETDRSTLYEQQKDANAHSGPWKRHEIECRQRDVDSTDRILSSNSMRRVEGSGRQWATAASIKLTDCASGQVRSHRLSTPAAIVDSLRIVIAFAAAAWVGILMRDGTSVRGQWRVWIDFGLMTALVVLMCTNLNSVMSDNPPLWSQMAAPVAICSAVAMCLLFLVTLTAKRQVCFWSALYAACMFPVLLPTVLLATIIRVRAMHSDRHASTEITAVRSDRQASSSQLRFGIHQLMLGTAAVAIVFGVGRQTVVMPQIGILLGTVVLLALLLSAKRIVAVTVCLFCVFAIVMLGLVNTSDDPARASTLGLLMLLLAICFAAVYGYSIKSTVKHGGDLPAAM